MDAAEVAPPVEPADIERAAQRIAGYVLDTPVLITRPDWGNGFALALKLEQLQPVGAFKVRGAFNRILSAAVPPAGVIAASGGNHGAAVAYAARRLGHVAEIFVPKTAPAVKVNRLLEYGARVSQVGTTYAEALAASEERARETGALQVHAYDQPEVIAGQGTIGRELERQVPGLDTAIAGVGGGGLAAGLAAWFRGRVGVVGVEPESAASMSAALRAGQPVDVPVGGVAADALGAARAGVVTFALLEQYARQIVTVTDDDIRAAQTFLWDRHRLIVEPGGAAGFAAVLSGAYRPGPDETVAVVLSGGNADLAQFQLR